ncbi:MAG: LysM peptidoglycan-binding domain-containing protein, partial [Rectinemataceae bacterium]|nr:LysM peptidoglycan-binding domain-containing protein [Rectinemataceae bacterium]
VSRKYKVSYEALAAANGITDPTKLRIGTILIIPSVHVVAKGETLYGISKQYGIMIGELLAANKLKQDYVLKIGDTLIVPAQPIATTMPPAVAPTTTIPSTTSTVITTSTTMQPVATTSSTTIIPATPGSSNNKTPPAGSSSVVKLPEPVKTQDRVVDMKLEWPVPGKAMYLDGKLEGMMIRVKAGEAAKAIASGTVVSAGPSRGFNQVAFIQAKSGYVYVYGGNEALFVKTGDQVVSGKEIGKIGIDAKDGSPIAYFFVFRNGQPIDPALAPRD